jgi:7,8-dihydropterin-6-yl-methyl-4-(beta-D-ribofuranosyl)aminobenzene 5'-phosphate synthase
MFIPALKKRATLLVGCSHSSIEVILDKTVAHTSRPIKLLYGGLHLIPFNREQLSQIISHIKDKIQVRQVAPTHCTGHLAFQMLQETYQENYLYAGLGETTNF